ncbi:hypothetical protein A2V56_05640 [Candidatus Woesebacteria bacterium RBG_19FT_COMBO_42_9]|uniref:Uncharacterized protein n=1 Tax=Candidatus Woesebacteria bacterium RBG_16_42_24 TaxID=1802485 RepID=A0A1F7XL03_9BACT|nr:MAG: hypothetical protein A2V97_02880 [Candidatus Woesebacteria bacterium RBG_16_42_24]OGM16096.1 MAG: hypothetical protein A2V56_05640 [Candidatus Woesebacteria bacterium RBG_19FT_COMBO_42_9]
MQNFNSKLKIFFVFLISLFTIHYSLFTRETLAHCPLCVGGAAIGLSVARFFGIDDAITGVWLAAFIGAISFWLDSWLAKKVKIAPSILRPATYIIFFGLTIWSFYAFNDYMIAKLRFYLVNPHAGQILGVDKLTFGVISGGILFYLVDIADNALIKARGKVFFPFQRIIVSLGSILILSLALYILLNYFI